MTTSPIEETHIRKCRVVINKRELEAIIREHVLKLTGFYPEATTVTFRFPDATEGSPPYNYKIGTECTADLSEDQMRLPRSESAT